MFSVVWCLFFYVLIVHIHCWDSLRNYTLHRHRHEKRVETCGADIDDAALRALILNELRVLLLLFYHHIIDNLILLSSSLCII
jgi:hypothetical protein